MAAIGEIQELGTSVSADIKAKLAAEEEYYKERNKVTPEQEKMLLVNFLCEQLRNIGQSNFIGGPYCTQPASIAKASDEIRAFIGGKLREVL